LAEEIPHMPSKDEILAKATEMFKADRVTKALPPITPTEEELKEGNWFEKARVELMSGYKSQLEEYLAYLESAAQAIRDELGIKPAPPARDIRELEEEIDRISARLGETKSRLREATAEIERLRAVKVPVKEVAPPPPKIPTCPAHKIELTEIIGTHEFPWGRVDVPSEMFLFQCPMEWEYYVCEPRKACVLVSLDKLKIRLARIVRPIAPPTVAPPMRVLPKGLVTYEELRREREEVERHPRFEEYITVMGYSLETYRVLDALSKKALLEGFRAWLERTPFRRF